MGHGHGGHIRVMDGLLYARTGYTCPVYMPGVYICHAKQNTDSKFNIVNMMLFIYFLLHAIFRNIFVCVFVVCNKKYKHVYIKKDIGLVPRSSGIFDIYIFFFSFYK